MERVAALYDVHGNLPALEAALADVERAAADLVVVGGDVASGPMPAEVLDRLLQLGDGARWLHGNADRALVEAFDRGTARNEAVDEQDVWLRRGAWCARRITRAHRDFLAALPEHVTVEIEGLGTTLFCHGSPRSDEEMITPGTADERLAEILSGVAADVVVCGHTHMQFDRRQGSTRVVNAGAVGMPYEGRPGAYWALLGPDVELRRTAYDFEKAASAVRETGFPAAEEHVADLYVAQPGREEAIAVFEEAAARARRER